MATIIITGTPGTGKSTLGKLIAKKLMNFNVEYVDLNAALQNKKAYGHYDKKKRCYAVDKAKIIGVVEKLIKEKRKQRKHLLIDSHLSHHLPKKMADLCIVATCGLKVLQERLRKRRYSPAKIRENLDAEIFQVCLLEAQEERHCLVTVDTTQGIRRKAVASLAARIRQLLNKPL